MWNKERTSKLIHEITQKYGSKIAIEGSNSVLGLEEHLDQMVARLMETDLEIIKVARHWRAVIKNAAITEGIDKVVNLLDHKELIEEELISEKIDLKEVIMKVESELYEPISSHNKSSIPVLTVRDTKEISADKLKEVLTKEMEDIRVTTNTDTTASNDSRTSKELQLIDEANIEEFRNSTLEESIWAPKKDSCKNKKDITAKVAAINVSGDSTEHRIKSLKWIL